MEKRIVAFDIGDKRIGVAVSDPFNEYAIPGETYWRTGRFSEDVQAIARIAAEKGAGTIVCGLPVNFEGTESVQTQKTRRFLQALCAATEIPVVTEDERFTTIEATRDLIRGGVRREKRKNAVDSLAAAYILEGYLARKKKEKTQMSMKEETNDYEEEGNVVELLDEDGNTLRYEHLGTVEYEGEWYCVFTPETEEDADEAETQEVAIFRLVGDEDNETLEIVEDDDLLDAVFEEFCRLYDSDEEEDGDGEEQA